MLKFILILLVIYFGFRLLSRSLFINLKSTGFDPSRYGNSAEKESAHDDGKVSVNSEPKSTDEGEFTDYEEIK